MSTWTEKTLGEVAAVGAGNSAPQDERLFADGDTPFFRTSDVGRIRFGDIETATDYLNRDGTRGLRMVPKGTILIPKSGASTFLNHRVMMAVDGCVSSHLATITVNPAIGDPRFLLFFLATVQAQDLIQDHAYPSLNLPVIAGIRVPIPPITEQRRIVVILDEAFDAIATAKANAEKNLKNARELFESHLSGISGPQVSLGEVVNITTGKLDANAAVEGGEYPFFTCSRDIYAIDEYAFDCEALLLAGNNAVGDFNVKHYEGKFNAYQRTYVITVNAQKRALCRFLYYELLKGLARFKSQSVGVGTKFLKIGMIKELQVALPNMADQHRLASLTNRIQEEVTTLERQFSTKLSALDELKKSLLHQAFTGALTDKSIDIQLEAVA